jgi:hypothetical protein
MKPKVLWIEDGAANEAAEMAIPVYRSRKYELVIALSATEGMNDIVRSDAPFDAIIVDIRLDSGNDSQWISLHKRAGKEKLYSRLGLVMLCSLLPRLSEETDETDRIKTYSVDDIPQWVTADRFGVLSVERWDELRDHLMAVGFRKADTSTRPLIFRQPRYWV